MKHRSDFNLGIMFRREHAPEHLPAFARGAEEAGFDELWLVEDLAFSGGIAAAAAALAPCMFECVGIGLAKGQKEGEPVLPLRSRTRGVDEVPFFQPDARTNGIQGHCISRESVSQGCPGKPGAARLIGRNASSRR